VLSHDLGVRRPCGDTVLQQHNVEYPVPMQAPQLYQHMWMEAQHKWSQHQHQKVVSHPQPTAMRSPKQTPPKLPFTDVKIMPLGRPHMGVLTRAGQHNSRVISLTRVTGGKHDLSSSTSQWLCWLDCAQMDTDGLENMVTVWVTTGDDYMVVGCCRRRKPSVT